MNTLENIEQIAITLSVDERLKLARFLICSVDVAQSEGNVEVDANWDAEISRRLRRYRAGESKTIPASKVFARVQEIASDRP